MNNRIQELREQKGVSQAELANFLGLTRQAISLYERGEREPKSEIWQKLADYFGTRIGYIMGYSELGNLEDVEKDVNTLKNKLKNTPKHYDSDLEKFLSGMEQKIKILKNQIDLLEKSESIDKDSLDLYKNAVDTLISTYETMIDFWPNF